VKVSDVGMIVVTGLGVAAPVAFAAMFFAGFNDKPWGYHDTPATYVRIAILGLVVGVVAWRVSRPGGPPDLHWFRCLVLGTLAATALSLSFCVWGWMVLDDMSYTWMFL
jgi:hypothetical protein